MREILDAIIEEKFEYGKKKIRFSRDGQWLDKLELSILPGEKLEGSFALHAPEKMFTYGYVTTSDVRMACITGQFAGSEEIHFLFDGTYMEAGEVCKGSFLIRCNQAETELPYEVRVQEEEILSSEGPIRSLIHFSNLAKVNWEEAVKIFYSSSFEELIRQKEPQLYLCYRGLASGLKNDHNLDQFLIMAGKKQRMSYFVEDSLLLLENPSDVTEISLGILRSGWGYTKLEVEAEGDFVFVEKQIIGEDDFLGNRYKLSVYIDSQKLHGGRNFGSITLWDNDVSVKVPVEVRCRENALAERGGSREKLKNQCMLTDIYQSFRLKEINTSDWLKETDRLVQRMMTLNEEDLAAKLYFAQILLTAERFGEAGWILEHVGEMLNESQPELEAYYLYLTSLLRKDAAYTKQVAEKILRIYKEKGNSWRAAWLLLYVSAEYERNVTGKWRFLEEQYINGCRSPILYLEAMQLLNRNPALLRKIEGFELQVLYYGNKKGILSPQLLEQFYYLAGRVKGFSKLLYRILENCYEKKKDERIVKEICTLLIKGNCVEKKFCKWFRLGVESGIKLTNLYEYYMMSLDLESEEEIPKIVLLYFTYQNNLDYAHAAYLYSYVLRKREEYPEIYESYRSRMEGFVREQVQRERINVHLEGLYHMFLTADMLQKQNAQAMLRVLFSYQMSVPNSGIRTAYVYQKDCQVPAVYTVTEKSAWLPIYTKESCVIWEDQEGNRFPAAYSQGIQQELAAHPIVRKGAVYIQNNPYLDLYLYEMWEPVYEADTELIARLFRIWKNQQISPRIRREAAVRIMKYYYHTKDKQHLADYLESLSGELLTRKEASEAIKYMVYCRKDELAYEWLQLYSPVLVDSKIIASLLASMIKRRGYGPEDYLCRLSFETFEKGKYTNEILQYLVLHYQGSAYNMYQVWKAALACEIDVGQFGERLLIQMLFTDNYVQEHVEVFKKYLKGEKEEKVVLAYLIRRCFGYYLEDVPLDGIVVSYLLQLCKEGCELPPICELTCLKVWAEQKLPVIEEQKPLLEALLRKQLQKGIHLPWFGKYQNAEMDLSALADKTILEYHATGDGPVKFRFMLLKENGGETQWKVMNMYPVCRRVFFTEQILFFGESLQYEILEESEGSEVVVKSGLLKGHKGSHAEGRFAAINALLEAKALQKEKQFEALLEDYLKKDFMNEQIFIKQ